LQGGAKGGDVYAKSYGTTPVASRNMGGREAGVRERRK